MFCYTFISNLKLAELKTKAVTLLQQQLYVQVPVNSSFFLFARAMMVNASIQLYYLYSYSFGRYRLHSGFAHATQCYMAPEEATLDYFNGFDFPHLSGVSFICVLRAIR